MKDVMLNFVNRSQDENIPPVVIFQKNTAGLSELPIAWTVIQNCPIGDSYPFSFPMLNTIAASDFFGNYTPQFSAREGDTFEVVKTISGDVLQHKGRQETHKTITMENNLVEGAIDANIFRDGKLLAAKTSIAPGQKAVFSFKPVIFIGPIDIQTHQGEVINSAVLATVKTEFSLSGIRSADIVMTGGGVGSDSEKIRFFLENVVHA